MLALRGWPLRLTERAVGVRLQQPAPAALAESLALGDLVRSYAFRGGSYLMAPRTTAVLHTVRTATRVWETERFQRQGGFAVDDWDALRLAVRDVLADGPRTRGEIAERLRADPDLRHLADAALGAGADTLYKPLHWWGEICFGPDDTAGAATFQLTPDAARQPPMDLDDAGRVAVRDYLHGYGPATADNLSYWLTEGLGAPRRLVAGWLADLGEAAAAVEVDGVRCHALATDLEPMLAAEPTDELRLLPGYDPWLLGPGTADSRIVPPQRRAPVTSGSDVVLRGGVVCATWRSRRDTVQVDWFGESGAPPTAELTAEAARLGWAEVEVQVVGTRTATVRGR